jgi:hypothetical protein
MIRHETIDGLAHVSQKYFTDFVKVLSGGIPSHLSANYEFQTY